MKLVLEEDNGGLITVLADTTDLQRSAVDVMAFTTLVRDIAAACATALTMDRTDPFAKTGQEGI